MIFNLLDLIKIRINNPPKNIYNYLIDEFHFINNVDNKNLKTDVEVNFSDELKINKNNFIVREPVGYDSEGVYWYDTNKNIARINFNDFDNGKTILNVNPNFNKHFFYILILYLISFKAFKFNSVFCHASAVYYKNKTILFPAWRHTGKTNLMLRFLEDGAELISDDGVLMFDDGRILSYSKRIHLLYYNFLRYPYLSKFLDDDMKSLFNLLNDNSKSRLLTDETFNVLNKLIRVRIKNNLLTNKKHSPKYFKCDIVYNLNKNLSLNNGCKITPISLDKLVVKASETSIFELSHFLTAYNAFSLMESNNSSMLQNSNKQFNRIFYNGFSKIRNIHEISFSDNIDVEETFNLVKNHLNEI